MLSHLVIFQFPLFLVGVFPISGHLLSINHPDQIGGFRRDGD